MGEAKASTRDQAWRWEGHGGMGEAKASTRNQAWRRVDCKITGSDGNIINNYYLCGYREKSFIKN